MNKEISVGLYNEIAKACWNISHALYEEVTSFICEFPTYVKGEKK